MCWFNKPSKYWNAQLLKYQSIKVLKHQSIANSVPWWLDIPLIWNLSASSSGNADNSVHSWTHSFTKTYDLTTFVCKVAASGGWWLLPNRICRSTFATAKKLKATVIDRITYNMQHPLEERIIMLARTLQGMFPVARNFVCSIKLLALPRAVVALQSRSAYPYLP